METNADTMQALMDGGKIAEKKPKAPKKPRKKKDPNAPKKPRKKKDPNAPKAPKTPKVPKDPNAPKKKKSGISLEHLGQLVGKQVPPKTKKVKATKATTPKKKVTPKKSKKVQHGGETEIVGGTEVIETPVVQVTQPTEIVTSGGKSKGGKRGKRTPLTEEQKANRKKIFFTIVLPNGNDATTEHGNKIKLNGGYRERSASGAKVVGGEDVWKDHYDIKKAAKRAARHILQGKFGPQDITLRCISKCERKGFMYTFTVKGATETVKMTPERKAFFAKQNRTPPTSFTKYTPTLKFYKDAAGNLHLPKKTGGKKGKK